MSGPVWRARPPSEPQDGAPSPPTTYYTLTRIQQMLGLSRYTIRQLIDGGFVSPGRGPGNAWRFEFRDVVLLRVANELREARIPTRRIMRSLARLRAELPQNLPLSGLRITAVGDQVAVRRRREAWDAETGQLLIDLDLGRAGEVEPPRRVPLRSRASASTPASASALASASASERGARGAAASAAREADAADSFRQAVAAEDRDPAAAERHYRRTLALDPGHADAVLNLSALLCEAGRFRDAVAVLDQAVQRLPDHGLLHFNRGVALEELGRARAATESYEAALRVDPDLADAHYNLARLHELGGDHRRALRHLSSYRRLTRP